MALKQSEIDTFKKKLIELRAELSSSFESTAEEVKKPDEATGYSQHQADQGTDDFDRTIKLELNSKEFEMLKLIDRALEKIEDGTYGICDVSGEPIPIKRLEAIPYACMTVAAQEKIEKGHL